MNKLRKDDLCDVFFEFFKDNNLELLTKRGMISAGYGNLEELGGMEGIIIEMKESSNLEGLPKEYNGKTIVYRYLEKLELK